MARNVFPKGVSVTAIINLMKPDGTAFSLQGYTYRLFYGVGSRWSEVTSSTVSGNVVSWVYAGSDQNAIGDYKLKLILYQNDTLFCTLNFNKAFTLYKSAGAANNDEEQEEQATNTVTLFSVAEYYLFQPILPAIGNDKYWYVNGAIVTDSHGEYVSAEHTIRYDSTSKNLIIDEGRVDKDGNSIEQTITDIATALASWASLYEAAEGSSAGSTAGDGSRWGAYKTAENARNTAAQNAETARQTAASNAEGTKNGSTAGDGSRWGEFKSAEAERETASETAIARANAAAAAAERMVEIHQGPPGDDGDSAYEIAVQEGFVGTKAEWLASLDGSDGTGIDEVEQTETSIANGGTNKVRITLTDGTYYDIQIKNGSSSNGLFPTSSALAAACPSPKVGDYAFVGDGFPADIYVCETEGTWTDSGEDFDGGNVDLTDYAKKAELTQLEAEVDGVNATISDFSVHQVQTSSAVDDPTGTRIRLVRKVFPGMVLSGQCTAGKGMNADIFDTYEHALECPSANRLQRFTDGNYVTTEWSGIVAVEGYLTLSLCKSDSSAFSSVEKAAYLAASSASVVLAGLDEKVAVLEGDNVFAENVSGDFNVKNHYIKYTDGSYVNVSDYWATPLYPVEGLDYFEYNIKSGGTVAAVVGYFASTEANGYISGIGGVNQTYTGKVYASQLPAGTKYVGFSGKGSYSATLHYSNKVKPSIADSEERIGFLYKSYTDALYVLRKKAGKGYAIDDTNGTRLRIIFKVPKGAHFKAASTEGVAVSLYPDITNAVLANTTYIETFAYSYVPEVGGVMSADGYLTISLTNGNTAITDAREAELLASLSLVVGYGMEWDMYALSTATGEGVVALNNDMDDALVSVGGVNAYASGTYDSFTVQKKNLSILAISDIHGTFEAISRAVEFANAKPGFFDYVACLGDIVLRSPADSITDFEDSFADCGKPFLFTVGNHDTADTNLAGITEAQARTKYFGQIETKGWITNFKDSSSCSWYKDDSTHKIRMISVFEYGNSQEIATGAPNTYCRRWIPSATLQWFADTLYSTPSDYSVVVLLHQIPFYPATYVDGKFTISEGIRPSIGQFFLNTVDGNPFGDIVNAFINGTNLSETYDSIASYNLGKTATVAKDFTGRGAGKFICFVVGHFHGSYIFKDATYPDQITVAVPSGSRSAFQQKYGDTNYAPNGRSEDQFYVIGFDTENELINIAKIGGQVSNDMVKRDIISIKY